MHPAEHPQHDPVLIAGLAADDLNPTDHSRAIALIDSCHACRSLRDDLVTIAEATRARPPLPAPRDFRITPEQAAGLARTGLARTGWFARFLGAIVGTGSFGRPLAATFTTLGLVGILVAGALPGLFGAASRPAPETVTGAGAGAGALGATAASSAPGAMYGPQLASAAPDDNGYGTKDAAHASDAPAAAWGGSNPEPSTPDARELARQRDEQANGLLLWGSVTLLGVGLALFALRLAGRRLR